LQLGSKWTKRMQKESSVSDGGEAIDMEVVSELARARSRSHALVVGRVHASRSATCRR
jgi:hypothetical protein